MLHQFTASQKRALAVLTVIALLFGAYFLRPYLILIAVGAVLAYLFTPMYQRFRRRLNSGLAATATLVLALLIVAIPVGGIVALAVIQITQMVTDIGRWMAETDLTALGHNLLDSTNDILSRIPFLHITLTLDGIRDWVTGIAQSAGHAALGLVGGSVGGVAAMGIAAILFLYVFLGLLTNGNQVVALFRDLNPLGPQASDLYLNKVGAMVTATVRGQFIIAFCQGTAAATSLYIGGLHDGFFMFVIFLTALSFIPLGAGIVTIPIGIAMALTGNVIGGIFVVAFHLIVVTNIDNFLRPFLVPKSAHLHPALMLLAVFGGLHMFGFWGIVLGPVAMIIIVTTISVYREVYKGVEMNENALDDEDDDDDAEDLARSADAAGDAVPVDPDEVVAPADAEAIVGPAEPAAGGDSPAAAN